MNDDDFKPLPAWKNAVAVLFSGKYTYGDIVSHEELRSALGLPKPVEKLHVDKVKQWEHRLLAQVDQLSAYLLEEKFICLRNVIGEGYMLVPPGEQTAFAVKQGQKDIKKSLRHMGRRLSFVDRTALTSEQAKENADALARLSFLQQQVKRARRMNMGDDPKQIST